MQNKTVTPGGENIMGSEWIKLANELHRLLPGPGPGKIEIYSSPFYPFWSIVPPSMEETSVVGTSTSSPSLGDTLL